MPPDATFRDMILAVRADEACHRETNHHFADLERDEEVHSQEVVMKEDGKFAFRNEVKDVKEVKI